MRWDVVGLDKQGPGSDRNDLESVDGRLRGGVKAIEHRQGRRGPME